MAALLPVKISVNYDEDRGKLRILEESKHACPNKNKISQNQELSSRV